MIVFHRGPANEWYDAVCILLRSDAVIRRWFGELLFEHPERFSEYLLESPTAEVFMSVFDLTKHEQTNQKKSGN